MQRIRQILEANSAPGSMVTAVKEVCLLPVTMAMSESGGYQGSYVGLWFYCSQGLCFHLWLLLPWSALLTPDDWVSSWGPDHAHYTCCHWIHIDLGGICCHLGPW